MDVMQLFDRIFFARRFDEWAERQLLLSAKIINQAAADIMKSVDASIEQASWKDAYNSAKFIRENVVPITREVAEGLAVKIIDEANESLEELVDLKLHWTRRMQPEPEDGGALEGVGDLAAAVIPLSVGAATAATLPIVAVSTTAVMLGLATVTTVSWPVVIAGSSVATVGVATGIIQSSKLWSKAEARLRKKSREYINRTLVQGTPNQLALLELLNAEFLAAAKKAKEL